MTEHPDVDTPLTEEEIAEFSMIGDDDGPLEADVEGEEPDDA